jgi:hypothetical protein
MLAAGTASLLGMSVRDLVAATGTDHAPVAENVVLFWCGGGMSHLDTWDPKPGRPTQGEFQPIATATPGIQITELWPNIAQQMNHIALVRSIAGQQADHGRASYQLQTSYLPSANLQHPGMGSVVVSQKKNVSDLPAFISISGRARTAGYLGQTCEAYFVAQPGEKDPYLAFPEGITNTRGHRRLDALAKMNQRFAGAAVGSAVTDTNTAIDDAVQLMQSPALEAFDLNRVSTAELNRYGNNPFGRGALLARRLIEKGVRFVQVNRGGFDLHGNIFPGMTNHGAVMDPAIGSLIGDLHERGLLEKTMIIVLSEFGRTPRVNDDAGRDHHAAVFSCLMAGGGIRGGQVIGSSDADGYRPADRPVAVPDLHASMCHALGINPSHEIMTSLGRPMKLVDGGQPVQELFS